MLAVVRSGFGQLLKVVDGDDALSRKCAGDLSKRGEIDDRS